MYPTANTNAVTQIPRHRGKKTQPDPSGRNHNTTKNETNIGNDTLAEWLRRRPAKPMGSPRVGSNPTGVVFPWTCPRGRVATSDIIVKHFKAESYDTVSEWLRRWTRNPLGSARRGSNPLGVGSLCACCFSCVPNLGILVPPFPACWC